MGVIPSDQKQRKHGGAGWVMLAALLAVLLGFLVAIANWEIIDFPAEDPDNFRTPTTIVTRYSDTCTPCGASFSVDMLQIDSNGAFSVHVTVENTAEFGDLHFLTGNAFVLDAWQAEVYVAAYKEAEDFEAMTSFLTGVRTANAGVAGASQKDSLPQVIPAGTKWTGWVGFPNQWGGTRGLPQNAVALVLVFCPDPDAGQSCWISSKPGQPYISIEQ